MAGLSAVDGESPWKVTDILPVFFYHCWELIGISSFYFPFITFSPVSNLFWKHLEFYFEILNIFPLFPWNCFLMPRKENINCLLVSHPFFPEEKNKETGQVLHTDGICQQFGVLFTGYTWSALVADGKQIWNLWIHGAWPMGKVWQAADYQSIKSRLFVTPCEWGALLIHYLWIGEWFRRCRVSKTETLLSN